MNARTIAPIALALTMGTAAFQAQAVLITFEDLDASLAGTVVQNQYAGFGITFSSPAAGPFLGKRGGTFSGGTAEGWQYPNNTDGADEFFPGQGNFAGNNFLTDVAGINNGGTAQLDVFYTNPVAALSFDIYDIDAAGAAAVPEEYTIRLRSSGTSRRQSC